MSRQGQDSKSTFFSRDTGQGNHNPPMFDPWAAKRHLDVARSATSQQCTYPTSSNAADSSSPSSFPGFPATGAERRPLEVSEEKLIDAPPTKKARVNKMIPVGERLRTFLENAPQAQKAMFAREARPSRPVKCPKPHSEVIPEGMPAFRCFDCYHAPVMCEDCIVRDHLYNPFHHLEVWTDASGFWERISLGQLNRFVLNLEHAGEECMEQLEDRLRRMTIVHEHGIVEMNVRFCNCIPKGDKFPVPEAIQLLHFGLFPGTWKEPWTAFTINGLRDYHLLSIQCQITGIDFATYLQRCTDNVLSKDERHRELNETMCNFMFLRATRRAHEEPKFGLDSGSLAVLCPACPQPHKNMEPEQHREREDSYLDMLFYTIDGNFQASQKFKPMDATDFPLTTGAGCYADERDYEVYLSKLDPRRKEPTTCRKFGAMGYSRYKGHVSGVVGLSCARHMFAIPCGTVDITGGESFAYPDYCMYDINCQYTVNLQDRLLDIRAKHPDLKTINDVRFPWTMVGIGKFHVAAHQESCRSKYSYYYLPGSAMTDGEAPERIWSTLNNLSLRTKEMSSGHRHDIINDYYADMNTRRLHNMHYTLTSRLERAKVEEVRTREYLKQLEENIPADKLGRWRVEEGEWKEHVEHVETNGSNFDSPYELKKNQDISQKDLLSSLVKKSGLTGESAVSLLDVIERGVDLQQERESLLDVLEKDNRGNLREVTLRCEEFQVEVDHWQILQETYVAPLLDDVTVNIQATMRQYHELETIQSGDPHVPVSEFSSPPILQSIPGDFPFCDVSADFRDVSTNFRESTDGLPRRRSAHGKTDLWKEIYDVFIPLPSSYHRAVRDQPSIHRLCTLEYDFRRVAADQALGDLRASIISCQVIKMRRQNSHSKKTTEKFDRRIVTANAEVANHGDHYRRHWNALRLLGMPDSDPHFRRLKDADAVNIDLSTAQNLLGQSKRPVSWIWGDFSFVESEDNARYQEFYDDARRVHWFRSSAVHACWHEEVHLLAEEMRRTLRFHAYQRDQWNARAREMDVSQEPGAAAYARKQAHWYVHLITACKTRFAKHIDLNEPSLRDALSADVQ